MPGNWIGGLLGGARVGVGLGEVAGSTVERKAKLDAFRVLEVQLPVYDSGQKMWWHEITKELGGGRKYYSDGRRLLIITCTRDFAANYRHAPSRVAGHLQPTPGHHNLSRLSASEPILPWFPVPPDTVNAMDGDEGEVANLFAVPDFWRSSKWLEQLPPDDATPFFPIPSTGAVAQGNHRVRCLMFY